MQTALRERGAVDQVRQHLGTPFRHQGRVSGVGLDWLGFLRAATGNTASPDMSPYPIQSYRNGISWRSDVRGVEPFLDLMASWPNLKPIAVAHACAGDVICFRLHAGDPVMHAGVLTDTDRFIHSPPTQSVCETRLIPWWQYRAAYAFKVTI